MRRYEKGHTNKTIRNIAGVYCTGPNAFAELGMSRLLYYSSNALEMTPIGGGTMLNGRYVSVCQEVMVDVRVTVVTEKLLDLLLTCFGTLFSRPVRHIVSIAPNPFGAQMYTLTQPTSSFLDPPLL